MPQLDRIIIFTQIFWLFLIFLILYAVLTHFFLPLVLKSLKSRKLIIESNSREIDNLSLKAIKKHDLLKESLIQHLLLIENYLSKNLKNSESLDFISEILIIDEKIAKVCINYALYCNNELLKSIVLYPKYINLKY